MDRKSLCAALFGFQIAYALLTMLSGRAFARTMFSQVEPVSYSLKNAAGEIDLKSHLPPVFYLNNANMVRYVAACLCRKNPQDAPYSLTVNGAEENPCAP